MANILNFTLPLDKYGLKGRTKKIKIINGKISISSHRELKKLKMEAKKKKE